MSRILVEKCIFLPQNPSQRTSGRLDVPFSSMKVSDGDLPTQYFFHGCVAI